ncbi:hypothetical protein [Arthrobacter sp. EpRS71]|uniref:hypothetical protein n=1 Tax=Arthrobacter sp. EpRS71 TaxID=1743141 RepID=UPI001E4C2B7A|nr:hypothetical protein [Arthrobacter sp. EpRS71]
MSYIKDMANKLAKKIKSKAVDASVQLFFVPSILRSIAAKDLSEIGAKVAATKSNQENEVGDGNS